MPQLKEDVINRIRANEKLIFKIADGMKRKFRTVETWLRDKDEMLASDAVVLIIRNETGLREEEILEPEPAATTL